MDQVEQKKVGASILQPLHSALQQQKRDLADTVGEAEVWSIV